MIWKREQGWRGQLGKAAAGPAPPALAAGGGGSGLALLPRVRGARGPAARGERKGLPVASNARENLSSGAGGPRASSRSRA